MVFSAKTKTIQMASRGPSKLFIREPHQPCLPSHLGGGGLPKGCWGHPDSVQSASEFIGPWEV